MAIGENVSRWVDNFVWQFGDGGPAYVADMLATHEYLRKSLENAARKDEAARKAAEKPKQDKVTYKIHWCWNGDKNQVDGTDEFGSKREWELVIDNMPFDILDASDTECWVDYGDNDDWE